LTKYSHGKENFPFSLLNIALLIPTVTEAKRGLQANRLQKEKHQGQQGKAEGRNDSGSTISGLYCGA